MRVNRVVKILIYSDLILVTAFALYGPIFAIFISQQIVGGGVRVAGLAAAGGGDRATPDLALPRPA